jgi:hypothetical protein
VETAPENFRYSNTLKVAANIYVVKTQLTSMKNIITWTMQGSTSNYRAFAWQCLRSVDTINNSTTSCPRNSLPSHPTLTSVKETTATMTRAQQTISIAMLLTSVRPCHAPTIFQTPLTATALPSGLYGGGLFSQDDTKRDCACSKLIFMGPRYLEFR